jgi:hypothetical protein
MNRITAFNKEEVHILYTNIEKGMEKEQVWVLKNL